MGELVLLMFCLLVCAYVASRAIMKIITIRGPQTRLALTRAQLYEDEGSIKHDRARDLLERASDNLYVADFKTAQVRVAYRWYRASLLILFFIVTTLLITTF